jgi:serine/threonine-protein kinase
MGERVDRLMDLFERALEVPAADRGALLDRECGTDADLRREMDSLLAAHESSTEFFDTLADDIVSPAFAPVLQAATRAREARLRPALEAALGSRYRVLHGLGGGMSRVFLAEEVSLGRKVVIKVLPPEMTAGADRFRREIRLVAEMQHPHIVPLLTSDSAESLLYYTMPFVAGESLSTRLARDGALPIDDARKIWRDILEALSYAHARGVIHRDIKPGNILLGEKNAMVTDFGIARAIEAAGGDSIETPVGVLLGTPAYAAPEQVTGDGTADHRADLYAAGLVMYEMLEGRLPFTGETRGELIAARLTSEPAPLARHDCPAYVADLVMRCLARDPDDRPSSAEAVLSALEAPVTPVVRRRVPARHRVTWYVVATVAALAAALGAWQKVNRGAGSDSRRLTSSTAAYEWYRRGMDVSLMRTSAGRKQAHEFLDRAIAADSNFAAAWAGLVHVFINEAGSTPGSHDALFTEAEKAGLKAVALDSSLAESHVALGWARMRNDKWLDAEASLLRGVALDPRAPRGFEGLARLYMWMQRPAEQLAAARKALEVEPYSHSAIREMALALGNNGRCDEAITMLRPLKELTPPAGVAGVVAGQCYAALGKWPLAVAEFKWAMETSEARTALAFYAYALARADLRVEANAILTDLLSGRQFSHGAFGIASVYAGLRDFDRAFEWLARAVKEHTIRPYLMGPMFEDLHRDPRFVEVKRMMGL